MSAERFELPGRETPIDELLANAQEQSDDPEVCYLIKEARQKVIAQGVVGDE